MAALPAGLRISVEPVIRVGQPANVTVAVVDELGNRTSDYFGTIQLLVESSSANAVSLALPYTFSADDLGVHVFVGALVASSSGTFVVKVSDTVNSSLTAWTTVEAVEALGAIIVREAASSAVAGQPWTYGSTGSVIAKGALPIEFTTCGAPADFWIDAATGKVSWTPTFSGVTETICIRAKNNYDYDEYTFWVEVKEAAPPAPVAVVLAEPAQGPAGMDVWLDASLSSYDPLAARFAWRFGDGSATGYGAEPHTRHRYLVPGGFNAEVSIRDAFGAESSARVAIRVTDALGQLPPIASIVATHDGTGTVTFTCECAAPDGGALTYRWDFGNGSYGSGPTATVAYASGRYHPTLLVVASNGLTAWDSTEVVVESDLGVPPSCEAWAEPTSAGLAPLSTLLTSAPAAGSASIVKVEWNVGGTAFPGSEVSYTFQAGVHEAKFLVMASDGQTCTNTVPITALAVSGEMPPVIVSAPPPPVACGAEWIYQPVAAGTGTFTWELKEAPKGMSIDSATGEIRWIADPRGVVPFRLKVSNGLASSAQNIALPVPCQPVELTTSGCAAAAGAPALLFAAALLGLGARTRRRRIR